MISQWVVDVLKFLTAFPQPRLRFVYPIRFITDLLFALSVFFWINRRPVANYNSSFFNQLLYVVQLIKVAYTLRFVLLELVFRELRTFFCFIGPLLSNLGTFRRWQAADPCVLKVVNLTLVLVFILLNFVLACFLEWLGRVAWAGLKDRGSRSLKFCPPFQTRGPRKKKKGKKRRPACYGAVSSEQSLSQSLLSTLSTCYQSKSKAKTSASASTSGGSSVSSREQRFLQEGLPTGYRVFSSKTRSGKV